MSKQYSSFAPFIFIIPLSGNIIPSHNYYSIPQKVTLILPNLFYHSHCHDEYLSQQATLLPISLGEIGNTCKMATDYQQLIALAKSSESPSKSII